MENIAVGNGQRTRVLECIRKVREKGGQVVVLGWMQRNHNRFTEHLDRNKLVVFKAAEDNNTPENAVVLCTKFITHSRQKTMERAVGKEHVFGVIGIGQIRSILDEIFKSEFERENSGKKANQKEGKSLMKTSCPTHPSADKQVRTYG